MQAIERVAAYHCQLRFIDIVSLVGSGDHGLLEFFLLERGILFGYVCADKITEAYL